MKKSASKWLRRVLVPGLVVPSLLATAMPMAMADDTGVKVFHNETPSSDQLVDALKLAPALPKFDTRGLKKRETAPATPPTASLKVNFAFGSYDLTGEAKQVLGNLAGALKDPSLRNGAFLIEGHTDAVGSDAYNRQLSEKRARAVKRFLVNVHGIESSRLSTAGLGESALLDVQEPNSGQNRRVQVKNMTGR